MKRGYSKLLYSQRNKNETIVSVIKRLFGEHIRSRLVRTQNRELSLRCIAYNAHRLTNIALIIDGFYRAPLLSESHLCMTLHSFTNGCIGKYCTEGLS